jgi:acyl-CoA synthetase (AMP-forming)/AMP-acid ligase II
LTNTVRGLVDHWAGARPTTPFLIAPESGRELDYAELQRAVRSIAARLAALGLAKGDTVAFLLNNGVTTTTLFLGTMYGGQVILPLNAVAGPPQLGYAIEHSDARILLISPEYRERLEEVLAQLPQPPQLILASENEEPAWPVEAAAGAPLPEIEAADDALLIYTSGTTGKPKGVVLSHRSVVAGGRNVVEAHELTSDDRNLCVLPLYHINAEIVSVMAPLASGGSVVMPHRFSASAYWDLVRRYECTWLSVVPTIISYLLDRAGREPECYPERPPHLRFGRSASAPLAPAVHQAFEERFGIPMIETLGLSETAAPILSNPMPPGVRKSGSPGLPYGNEIRIVDREGRDLPPGESGEILVRGDNVMSYYYKNPEATREALEPDGWLHTGDLAYRDADGYVFIAGRLKEIIIKGGENVAPREIDDVLYKHPAVLEAAAFAVPDDNYGQEIMAGVVAKPGMQLTEQELRELCIRELGPYKTPKAFYFLDALPKGPSGKVQRLKVAEMVSH